MHKSSAVRLPNRTYVYSVRYAHPSSQSLFRSVKGWIQQQPRIGAQQCNIVLLSDVIKSVHGLTSRDGSNYRAEWEKAINSPTIKYERNKFEFPVTWNQTSLTSSTWIASHRDNDFRVSKVYRISIYAKRLKHKNCEWRMKGSILHLRQWWIPETYILHSPDMAGCVAARQKSHDHMCAHELAFRKFSPRLIKGKKSQVRAQISTSRAWNGFWERDAAFQLLRVHPQSISTRYEHRTNKTLFSAPKWETAKMNIHVPAHIFS